MRKRNAVISLAMLVLFLVHGIAGAFQMMGIIPGGNSLVKGLTWLLLALLFWHAAIGVVLTAKTLRAAKKAGVFYGKENVLFVIQRISGFALLLLLCLHLFVFLQTGSGVFRLHDFGAGELIGQLVMLGALAIHLLCGVKPAAIALGLYKGKGFARDVLLILAIVLAFCAAAFVVYYLRWNVVWRAQ